MAVLEVDLLEEPPGSRGVPLVFVETHPDFPPDGKADPSKGQKDLYYPLRKTFFPRLLEVHHREGFWFRIDCSNLKGIEAVINIIYNFNPALLQKFFDYTCGYVSWCRNSHQQQKYDIEITRSRNMWYVRLWDTSDEAKASKEAQKEKYPFMAHHPYLYFSYLYAVTETKDGQHLDPPVKNWEPCKISGKHIGGRDGCLTGRDDCLMDAAFEPYATKMARYMMLLRPWEERPGVEFEVVGEVEDVEMKGFHWFKVIPDWHAVDMQGKGAVRINHVYPGASRGPR